MSSSPCCWPPSSRVDPRSNRGTTPVGPPALPERHHVKFLVPQLAEHFVLPQAHYRPEHALRVGPLLVLEAMPHVVDDCMQVRIRRQNPDEQNVRAQQHLMNQPAQSFSHIHIA